MSPFQFDGQVPSSKSMFNRALLVQSFFPQLKIEGHSVCDDVRHMKQAVVSLIRKNEVDCGEAGTVFRFMAMRASREKEAIRLKASRRLMTRPQEELAFILNQLGVNVNFLEDGMVIQSEGWKKQLTPVQIPRARSSQFASGLLLSAWNLPFDLELILTGSVVSEGYWQMSQKMAEDLGMDLRADREKIVIPAGQTVRVGTIEIEPDFSSMFSVAAAALVAGDVRIQKVPSESLQPDSVFLNFLKKMKASAELKNGVLSVSAARELAALDVSLKQSPDLFPVLAALCAFATGTSHLREAPHLAYKESDRIHKTAELLQLAGVECVARGDGLTVHGEGAGFKPKEFTFDPDQDHRMAMAASLFRLRERKIRILSPEVVKKSFPEYWSVVGLG